MDDAVKFFYDNAGWSHDPVRETSDQGRIRCAEALARAEQRRKNEGAWVAWERDDFPFGDDIHESHECGYIATVWQYDAETDAPVCLASLSAVDAEAGDDYRRVVEAELASEAWPE